MIDYNVEFTRGVLFVRLFGNLNRFNKENVENEIFDIIKDGGIRYLVFNTDDLEIEEDVDLFKKSRELVERNDGKMLLCGNMNEFYVDDFEIVSDELSALKLLSVC